MVDDDKSATENRNSIGEGLKHQVKIWQTPKLRVLPISVATLIPNVGSQIVE
jgi:hypothetical protein